MVGRGFGMTGAGKQEVLVRLEAPSRICRTESVESSALYDVDVAINLREFVAVIGLSGCGKYTLPLTVCHA